MNNTLAMWARDYRDAVDLGNAPDYGTPTEVIAIPGRYGSAIMVGFEDGSYLTPWFNQSDSEGDGCGKYDGGLPCRDPQPDGTRCEFGWCTSDRFSIERDAEEFLSIMAGATDWYDWAWEPTHPNNV